MIFKCDYFLLPGLTCTASGWNVPALVICEENLDPGRETLLLTLELGTTMAEVLTYELRPLFSSTPVSLLTRCSYTLNAIQSSFCSRRTGGDAVARCAQSPLPVFRLPEAEIQSYFE